MKFSALRRFQKTRDHLSMINAQAAFSSVVKGSKYTLEFSKYLKLANSEIGSYFHDVPLELDTNSNTATMVVEVPRWSNGKFEISKELDFNPIKQDMKNGKPRFVNNIFPFKGYITNYGAFPQTWEDPTHESIPGLKGDNDPLDCCEIGSGLLNMGDIKRVKILGSLALIDSGELDWKVIVMSLDDPTSNVVNNLDDVERVFPQLLSSIKTWFRDYKIPTGKPANQFAFGGEYKDINETMKVIADCHESWKRLVSDKVDFENLPKTRRAGENFRIEEYIKPDASIPPEVNKWYHI
ncbi:inorganic diphosphatase PPA2 Ecym_2698 [Eremothecium cymbalariae DBVPG|uniref:inorganic diphosphatase n=1 Tax=Eremothecium cymbalariae (strain CBS 270.75 / DBVPG 7215 / KCTC 17166 / NRRL Y-17582) TaxID=931890 RepID=G8JPD9_ERECY|nr:Hypothetical protein Ecym_2698 [Eremothecium cymbalariae DBVPG\